MNNYQKLESLDENGLVKSYETFIEYCKKILPDNERNQKLLKLYEDYADRMIVAPASGKANFHYAVSGGYIFHIMNVCKAASGVKLLFSSMGGKIDFTDEEMYFSALNHDLGKLGDEEGESYVPEQSEWHRKNQGTIFKRNPEIQKMAETHRALYLLQKYNIQVSKNEWLSIFLSNGKYDSANDYYLVNHSHDDRVKSNLPYVIHWADFISARSENSQWQQSLE